MDRSRTQQELHCAMVDRVSILMKEFYHRLMVKQMGTTTSLVPRNSRTCYRCKVHYYGIGIRCNECSEYRDCIACDLETKTLLCDFCLKYNSRCHCCKNPFLTYPTRMYNHLYCDDCAGKILERIKGKEITQKTIKAYYGTS